MATGQTNGQRNDQPNGQRNVQVDQRLHGIAGYGNGMNSDDILSKFVQMLINQVPT